MAYIELKVMFPFTSWDAAKKYGRSDESIKVAMYKETAKTKAGMYPFIVTTTYGNGTPDERGHSKYFTGIDDALEYMNAHVQVHARKCGWKPEDESGPITQRFNVDIDLDNDAFEQEQGTEIARILRNLASAFDHDGTANGRYDATLFDSNGNRCGTAKINVKGG